MESAICLCYYPLPSAPLSLSYGSKGSQDARLSRFLLRFNHATPLCLPHFSTTRPVARSFKHANCMLERFSVPSKNEGSDNKILRGVTGVSVVLACVLGLFNFSSKMNPKFSTAYASSSPTKFNPAYDISVLDDKGKGKVALESLLEMINAEYSDDYTPQKFDREPSKTQVDALKLCAIGLSKDGKRDEAMKIVQNEYNKWKYQSEAEHNLGMALIELLMFQENYEEARKRLDDQIDKLLSPKKNETPKQKCDRLWKLYNKPDSLFRKLEIARLLLYKAIVHTMLEDMEAVERGKGKEAMEWRKAFKKTINE